jgi:hypothetical protein
VEEGLRVQSVPVWSRYSGGICTGETYKSAVKLTFFMARLAEGTLRDCSLSSLEGNTRARNRLHEDR